MLRGGRGMESEIKKHRESIKKAQKNTNLDSPRIYLIKVTRD
jgi:hypothetical protein